MENKEIKIKSYLYMQQNMLILLTAIFGVPTIFIAIFFKPFSVIPVAILGSIALLFLIGAIITRFGCRTYDIYTEHGVKRVRRNKEIFCIQWGNAESAFYDGFWAILVLSPFVLDIKLKESLIENEDRSYDNKKAISTPMSRKIVKRISSIIPIKITNIPK